MLTDCPLCSFVDRDMLMRHFGHGVGHFQYQRQPESEPDMAAEGNNDNTWEETEESDEDISNKAQDEVEPRSDPEIDEKGDGCSEDDTVNDVDDSDGGENSDNGGGYASY